jgi:mannose-6-phosphate isomerase-like protein (cupin superfamily)
MEGGEMLSLVNRNEEEEANVNYTILNRDEL